MLPVAFLTQGVPEHQPVDDHLAARALEERGYRVESLSWESPADWRSFRAVVVRSTWDYQGRPTQFLDRLRQIESASLLLNDSATVGWNIRKDYLRERFRNVRRIPTFFGNGLTDSLLDSAFADLNTNNILIKPLVGAGAVDIIRLQPSGDDGANEKAKRTEALRLYAHREFLIQPLVSSVKEQGELSVVFFGGRYSHAVRKLPQADEFRVQERYGGTVEPARPDPLEAALAEAVMLEITPTPLYARVDLVTLDSGEPALMEVELTEPDLFFRTEPGAASRFADELDRRLFRTERVSPAR